MKKVFFQKYSDEIEITCYYGKPPEGYFEGDVIKLRVGKGDDLYMTPDEASTMIRALSAGLSHYLVKNDRLAKLKNENENKEEKSHL